MRTCYFHIHIHIPMEYAWCAFQIRLFLVNHTFAIFSLQMDMYIGMFYGYEYECFASDTIFILPNCAFIPLEINHAALYAAYMCVCVCVESIR